MHCVYSIQKESKKERRDGAVKIQVRVLSISGAHAETKLEANGANV